MTSPPSLELALEALWPPPLIVSGNLLVSANLTNVLGVLDERDDLSVPDGIRAPGS